VTLTISSPQEEMKNLSSFGNTTMIELDNKNKMISTKTFLKNKKKSMMMRKKELQILLPLNPINHKLLIVLVGTNLILKKITEFQIKI